jgi:hypothetical protein
MFTYVAITSDHWAYKYHDTYTHITMDGHLFPSEAAAADYCAKGNAWSAAMQQVRTYPEALDRATYEQACAALGATPLDDRRCTSYDIQYGDFRFAEVPLEHCITMALAKRRGWQVQQERQPPAPAPAPEMVRASCGHTVPRTVVMSASLGTACPDCYDRLED